MTVIKTLQYWHKNRHIGKWSRTESPETSPLGYSQLIDFTRVPRTFNGVFNKWCQITGQPQAEE